MAGTGPEMAGTGPEMAGDSGLGLQELDFEPIWSSILSSNPTKMGKDFNPDYNGRKRRKWSSGSRREIGGGGADRARSCSVQRARPRALIPCCE
jgi:hypothetical protein